jgi:hypothetical protein
MPARQDSGVTIGNSLFVGAFVDRATAKTPIRGSRKPAVPALCFPKLAAAAPQGDSRHRGEGEHAGRRFGNNRIVQDEVVADGGDRKIRGTGGVEECPGVDDKMVGVEAANPAAGGGQNQRIVEQWIEIVRSPRTIGAV